MRTQVRGAHTHYWLHCDVAGCFEEQPDVALSEKFCVETAGDMGWRRDPATLDDYCPTHRVGAEANGVRVQLPMAVIPGKTEEMP